jgi:RNA polymerase sigma-70 factor (ECF subfamily)
LRVKVAPSDLVQETFRRPTATSASSPVGRSASCYPGCGRSWFGAWPIRPSTIAARRDHQRQESLEHLLEQSSLTIQLALASQAPSPSEAASRREQAVLLADAVDRLPPDYREAFVLRTLEHVPFEEIARRMGRSTGAVRMLWARAVKKLNQMLEGEV